jgi:hypothetical protein
MKISKVQEAVFGLNRSWSRPCFFVAAFLLAVLSELKSPDSVKFGDYTRSFQLPNIRAESYARTREPLRWCDR